MQSFVIRPMTWPILRLFSRNPLIRTSDRIETAVVTLAVLLVVIAAACAGALGTVIHDTEAQNYRQQAQTRHAVVATAIDDSKPAVSSETTASTVYARWQVNGIDHADVLGSDYAVKAGEPLQIWVGADGNRVNRPTPVERAAADALSAAVVGWLIVALAAAQVVWAVRAHASRMRDAQWERDIRCLVDDDGGRTNRSQ
ncbi:Rv1733c family protein [Mycobacterium sp.]|uniref:Rv1733c family protein n=1 Tax=Mycobacterium sp. TaxID=1785 RepID=UPI003F96AE72